MSDELILYDLPSRGKPFCWSLNPWKTRLALNYKGIPYRTEWVEYPDIAPKFKSYGITPNTPDVSSADYSIPAARLPDGTYIMDSAKIAPALDRLQAEKSLRLDNGYTKRAQEALVGVFKHLRPMVLPRVPEMVLSPGSVEYFNETREKMFGMPLTEVVKSPLALDAFKNAEAGIENLKALLNENEGPFVEGQQVSYADFTLAGAWRFLELLDKDGDLFGKLMAMDASFPKHVEACRQWMKRDD